MPNTVFFANRKFYAFSGSAVQQAGKDVPLDDTDIDTRDKVTVTVNDNPSDTVIRDCGGVFVDSIVRNTNYKLFSFVYAAVTPKILARWAAYYFGATTSPTGANANEAQTLTTSNDAAGVITLSLPLEGRTGITRSIPIAGLTAAALKAALTKKGASIENIIKDGDVVVTGSVGALTITFGGRLAGANLPLLVVGSAGLSAGTSVIAASVDGDSKYFQFARATSEEKVRFSFAAGDLTGNLATEKFYNAVCSAFTPTINKGGDVGLTVTVLCNYDADDIVSFPIPDCINYPPLKAADCRVKINGAWETFDIFSETITADDGNNPDFGFDSFAPDTFYRNETADYPITGTIFGVKGDPFGVLAYDYGEAEYITHFGMPGNRFSLIAPRVIFSAAKETFVGSPRSRAAIEFTAVAARDGVNSPLRGEAFLPNQNTAFLLT